MNKKEMNNKGFSLVELIIVIAIMAILVGVLAPQFIKYVERSRVAKDMQNVQLAKTAIEASIAGDQATSGTYSIKVDKSNKKIDVTTPVTIEGLDDVALASANWSGDVTYTYDFTTYTWGTPASCTNGTYDMKSVFQ